jgi:hypothetical protein
MELRKANNVSNSDVLRHAVYRLIHHWWHTAHH